jgi:hypothetical protein
MNITEFVFNKSSQNISLVVNDLNLTFQVNKILILAVNQMARPNLVTWRNLKIILNYLTVSECSSYGAVSSLLHFILSTL